MDRSQAAPHSICGGGAGEWLPPVLFWAMLALGEVTVHQGPGQVLRRRGLAREPERLVVWTSGPGRCSCLTVFFSSKGTIISMRAPNNRFVRHSMSVIPRRPEGSVGDAPPTVRITICRSAAKLSRKLVSGKAAIADSNEVQARTPA